MLKSILLLSEYYQKCTRNKTIQRQTYDHNSLLGTLETCGGVKLVKWGPNSPSTSGQNKKSKKTT